MLEVVQQLQIQGLLCWQVQRYVSLEFGYLVFFLLEIVVLVATFIFMPEDI